MLKKYIGIPLVISLFTLSGCGSDGGDSEEELLSNIESLEDLVGVYLQSTTQEDLTVDEKYFVVDDEGAVTLYDYEGDSYTVDTGENCYRYLPTGVVITGVSSNQVTSTWFGTDYDIAINSEGDTYEISHDILGEVTWTKIELFESDLTPLCATVET